MPDLSSVTEEFVRTSAPNPTAFQNAKKISQKGGFQSLFQSEDHSLIFGECAGSGKTPYSTSVDFSGDAPVFRCSCPSRQFPCKHGLAILLDYLAGKPFPTAAVPEEVERKRNKLAARAEKAENPPAPKKSNPAAAAKKLHKQLEGLALAEQFASDLLTNGIASVSSAACARYQELAKQLGDYYLTEPQAIIYEIVHAAGQQSEQPDDAALARMTALCVRLAASVRKCRDYINRKLESGEVLPDDDALFEAMGGVRTLAQLKELGMTEENVSLMQLAFFVRDDPVRQLLTDTAYWLDLRSGAIVHTENIRPYKALKHVKAEDSVSEIQNIPLLCRYPGGLNPRVRWESATPAPVTPESYQKARQLCEPGFADAAKKVKNELKNTLGQSEAAVLLPFDAIALTADGQPVLRFQGESLRLCPDPDVTGNLDTLCVMAPSIQTGAAFGLMRWDRLQNTLYFCPLSVLTDDALIRL